VRWLLFLLLILLIPKRNVVTVVPDRSPGDGVEFSASGQDELSIVVDIANVMGARPDGWWRDPAGAALRLCREITALAARGLTASELPAGVPETAGIYWVLVLEGRARKAAANWADEPAAQSSANSQHWARIVLAPGSGDDTIAVQARDLQGCRLVVTADRELRRRCEQAGAIIVGPRWLLALL